MSEIGAPLEELQSINTQDVEHAKDTFGQVERLAAAEDVYFVHGIDTNSDGGTFNDAVSDLATFEDRLAIAILAEPTLPCSSVSKNKHRLWSEVGVILNKGRIESAGNGDSGSLVNTSGERTGHTYSDEQTYKDSLLDAIRNPLRGSTFSLYNEFAISRPQIAGMYINLDQPGMTIINGKINPNEIVRWPKNVDEEAYDYPVTDVRDMAQEFGMKLFAFQNGRAHTTDISPTGDITLGEIITPEQMITQTYHIPEENKERLVLRATTAMTNPLLSLPRDK